ncbi:hypothetical protein HDU82_001083, partial [Entophlyctis luteolus]
MSDAQNSDGEEQLDGFECRAQFKLLLSTLTPSSQVVKGVAQFALKPSNKEHAAIMYGCVRERLDSIPTRSRLLILYVLDAICQQCVRTQEAGTTGIAVVRNSSSNLGWLELVGRDLVGIVGMVVPQSDTANLSAIKRVVVVWRSKRVFGADVLDRVELYLATVETSNPAAATLARPTLTDRPVVFSRQEIMRKIEEERDQHKKSRESKWYRQQNQHYQAHQEKDQSFKPVSLDESVLSVEFADAWDKIPGLTMEPCREWDLISNDLL